MTRTLTACTLILSLAACTAGPADDYAKVLPDDRLLVNLPADFGGQARSAVGDPSEYYAMTLDVTTDINTFVGDVLDGIAEITSFDPTWANDDRDKAVWGPWEDGDVNGRLWVRQRADGGYDWALDAKFVDEGDDAWAPVFAGQIDPEATEVASSGRFAADFAQLGRFEPDKELTGSFYVAYDVDGDVVDAEAGFEGFSEDGGPVGDAVYVYSQDGTGSGKMDLAYSVDEYGGPDPELHVVRSRWTADGEGRADAYLTEGDFGPLVYTATECWDSSFQVVFYEENYSMTRDGDEAACAFAEDDFNDQPTAPQVR